MTLSIRSINISEPEFDASERDARPKVFGFLANLFCLLLISHMVSASFPAIANNYQPLNSPSELQQTEAQYLKPGQTVERELKGAEKHSYGLRLAQGQYAKVVVEQKGIDVAVRLVGPDGQKMLEVDSPNGTQGPETGSVVAEKDGEYRLEVEALDGKAAPGRYEVKVEELREATSGDRISVEAERVSNGALAEAEQLRALRTPESLRKALEKYNEALPPLRFLKETEKEAYALNQAGWVYRRLGENAKAVEYYHQALPLWRAVRNGKEEATTLNNIAVAFWSAGDGPKAVEYYHQTLPLWRAMRNVREEGNALYHIGFILVNAGDDQKALEYLNQALPLRRAAGDRVGEAQTLDGLGVIHDHLGKLHESVQYHNLSLAVWEALGDRRGEASALSNVGVTYLNLGESQKAVGAFTRALTLLRALGDRKEEANTLNNLGLAYGRHLGDNQKALEYLNQALPLWRAMGNRSGEFATLQNLSLNYVAEGDARRALEYLEQALSLARATGNPRNEAIALDTIGAVYGSLLGDSRKALELYEQALPLRRATGDRIGEATTLSHIGAAYTRSGRLEEAVGYLRQALALHRAVGAQNGEAETLKSLAIAERDLRHLDEARSHVEAALKIHEGARAQLYSQQLRTSFSASRQDYYELYIDVLMRMHKERPSAGHDADALRASERARVRSLLEILSEAKADIRQGVDTALLERERALRQQLSAKSEQLAKLLGGKHTEVQEREAKKEVGSLLGEYQEVGAQIRARSPRYASLTQPQPLSVREIQQLLGEDTLLFEYSLGEERSYLWVVTPTSINSFELPKRAEIEAAARHVYELFTARNQIVRFEEDFERRARVLKADAEFPKAAGALSRMLLGSVADQLKGKRLLVVSDGVLQYLPFAALPPPDFSGKRSQLSTYVPLIASHEVVSLPSASALAVLRKELAGRKPAPKMVAVFADPVFDSNDERVKATKANTGARPQNSSMDRLHAGSSALENELTRSVRDLTPSDEPPLFPLPRLPFTRQEAESVVAFTPSTQYEKATDFAANRAATFDPGLSQYRYIHFATHAILNTQHPELSGIVLSLVNQEGNNQDGFLLAHEIYNLNLPAELIVLSGCRTGLGKEVKGEGLLSLTRGFMYAGGARVLVSLWEVNDKSTAQLMARLYKGMLGGQRLSPAAALRQAQIEMWRSAQWRAPYYWAAFAIHGEYR